jgi:F0F1-type ATP synthase assembly protein I
MSVLFGRDWKRYPLTRDEARAMRERSREERENDWQSFRHNWPMHAFELLLDFGGATLLGVLLGLALMIHIILGPFQP